MLTTIKKQPKKQFVIRMNLRNGVETIISQPLCTETLVQSFAIRFSYESGDPQNT